MSARDRRRPAIAVHDHRYDDADELLGIDDVVGGAVGLVLTHRLTAEERHAGMVAFGPDLLPFRHLDEQIVVLLADGSALDHEHLGTTTCAWAGPPGWLDGFADGDLIAFRIDDQIVLHLAPAAGDLAVEAGPVGDAFARLRTDRSDGEPVLLSELAAAVAADEADDRRPRAPLGERITAAGLEARDEHVAEAGFDWAAWERRTKVQRLLDAYGLLSTDEPRVLTVLDLADATDPADDALAAAASTLTEPALAQLVADDLLGPEGPEDVETFARRLGDHAGDAAGRAAARWLLGRALEQSGDVLAAERELTEAVALAPAWPPALEDLAAYTGDRGDAKRTLDLLLRAGASSRDATIVDLRDLVARSASRAGRNDPCPCGSGKKFKACHWGQESIPLERRIGWLWNKAATFAQRGPQARLLLDIARAYAGPVASNRVVIDLAFGDGVVVDLAVHEGGAFQRFLEVRGVLLPDDERALAGQWVDTTRAVYEVAEVRRGEGIVVAAAESGERYVLRDRLASRTATAGAFVATRLVPDGTGERQMVGGGVVVRADAVAELQTALDARLDAVATAQALGDAAVR